MRGMKMQDKVIISAALTGGATPWEKITTYR